jgi:growth-arrest-specific protein 2
MAEEVFQSREIPRIVLPLQDTTGVLSGNHSIRSRQAPAKPTISAPYPQAQALLAENNLTATQRDLVLRVIDAAEKLQIWCETVDQWGWSGSFAPPLPDTNLALDSLVHAENVESNGVDVEYWGCLPSKVVEEYESQLDSIHEEMEKLDLDELKERILGIHLGNSRPSSRASTYSVSRLEFLDDFTFFVTKTLLQFLPSLSKLVRQLKLWSTRLVVLRIVPSFLHQLHQAHGRSRGLWEELAVPVEENENAQSAEESRLEELRESSKRDISDAGRLLDSMLDLLESYDDVLPDSWIDEFETIESDLGTWSRAAEQKLFEMKMRQFTNRAITDSSIVKKSDPVIEEIEGQGSQTEAQDDWEVISSSETPQLDDKRTVVDANDLPIVAQANILVHEEILFESSTSSDEKPENCQTDTEAVGNINNRISSSTTSDSQESGVVLSSPSSSHNVGDTENLPSTQPSSPIMPSSDISGVSDVAANGGDISDSPASGAHNSTGKKSLSQIPSAEISEYSPYPEESSAEYLEVDDLPLDELHIESLPSVEPPMQLPSTEKGAVDNTVIRYEQDATPIRHTSDHDPSMMSAMSGTSILSEENDSDNDDLDESPSRRLARVPPPPLNAMVKKRQTKAALPSIVTIPGETTLGDMYSPDGVLPSIEIATPTRSPISPVIPLQERISSILEAIPTPIRLKSGPSANAPEIKRHRARTPSLTLGRRPITHAHQPTITLAPADEAGPRRSNSKEPDIRLYHLIHTGRDKPIKLFIRRVGENGERVMVRVGGGWADLGEYLQVYVEHHGRRATSEGRVDITPINNATGSPTAKPTGSRRSSLLGPSTNSSFPPGSQSQPTSAPRPESALGTPTMQSASSSSDTPQSQLSGASRRSVTWNEASLAGPYAKRSEVSGEKQEWIDGIVEQAKKSMGKKVEVGDLGKTGATRRIFFKGRSATPTSRAGTPTDGRATPTTGRRSATPNQGRRGTPAPGED